MVRRDRRLSELAALYERDFAAFVRVSRGIVGDRELALDAVHDAFASVIRAKSALRDERALEAWVWRAVVNAARKVVRDRRDVSVPEVDAPAEPPAVRELAPNVARLPERQRLIVFLRYYADLDYRRIAGILGVEVGTVSAALAAAHRSIRRTLEEVEVVDRH